MGQLAEGFGFDAKPAKELGIVGEGRVQHLHRDLSGDLNIVGQVDPGRRAGPQEREKAVALVQSATDQISIEAGHTLRVVLDLWETGDMVKQQGADTVQSSLPVAGSVGRTRFGNRRELAGRLGVALAVAFALWLLVSGLNENKPTPERAGFPTGLESVSPANLATNVPSQATIVADLEFGQTGVLVINSREIPLDQLDYERATGTLSFTPGVDREFAKLPGSDVRAVVVFWPEQGDRATDAREFAWTFKVS